MDVLGVSWSTTLPLLASPACLSSALTRCLLRILSFSSSGISSICVGVTTWCVEIPDSPGVVVPSLLLLLLFLREEAETCRGKVGSSKSARLEGLSSACLSSEVDPARDLPPDREVEDLPLVSSLSSSFLSCSSPSRAVKTDFWFPPCAESKGAGSLFSPNFRSFPTTPEADLDFEFGFPLSNRFRERDDPKSPPLSWTELANDLGLKEVPKGLSVCLGGMLGTGGEAIPIGLEEGEALAEEVSGFIELRLELGLMG